MAKHPNIEIEMVPVPENITGKIQTMTAAGTPPDMAMSAGVNEEDYAKVLYDFTDYVKNEDIDWDIYQYPEIAKAALVSPFDGKIYGLPTGSPMAGSGMMPYNVTLMKENGLQEPSEPFPRRMTISEFIDYNRKIKKDLDGDGETDIYGSGWLYFGHVFGWFPGSIDDEDHWNEETTWTKRKTVEAFEFMELGHITEKWALPMDLNAIQWFVQDKVGFKTNYGGYMWPEFRKIETLNWDICPPPLDDAAKPEDLPQYVSYGRTVAVFKATKYPDAAWEWIKFEAWDFDYHQANFALGQCGPTKVSQAAYIETMPEIPKHKAYLYTPLGPVLPPPPRDLSRVRTWDIDYPLWDEKELFYYGEMNAEEFVAHVHKMAAQIIKEGKEQAAQVK
jgi:multiple sugar transport system substrate-binding protein